MHTGEFGVVYRAHLIGWGDSTTPELVAVKTLRGSELFMFNRSMHAHSKFSLIATLVLYITE